ncbi:MAG: periplasmic heavy metal sensor [Bacteroidetes bacterium]|jgi:hypothetical protein|nr:periplasmic heavy metal sensor [Bacteroidota bacterium]MBT6687334.1 periplasmic heavy metal sensor [Bacteroidota bacterium]MBT7144632.1 periplasmic heavy metal sensor [Bacteroidota bacterium]MBT7490394.1 periplasmic heavy metal sensor [Bacteroidota bacterium]
MNYLYKKQLISFAIIFLVVINIATIASFIFHLYSEQDIVITTKTNENKGIFLAEELDLSNEQLEKYQQIKSNFHLKTENLNKLLSDKTTQMFNELSKTDSDTVKLSAIAQEIGEINEKQKRETINQFLEIESICTVEQKEKLYETYESMLNCIWPGQGQGRKFRGGRGEGFKGGGRGFGKGRGYENHEK